MGGHAFERSGRNGEPALKTPRLSLDAYKKLKDHCKDIAVNFYHRTESAPEAPDKADYGDLDILVASPRFVFDVEELASGLDAKRFVVNGRTTSFAVPHPNHKDTYAQVDLECCDIDFFGWELFMKSYGDLWQILGVIHRGLGLTATDRGLHIRVMEIEDENRKASMLFLTRDPVEAMAFLGLDAAKHSRGFDTVEEIYEWCTSGRFYRSEPLFERGDQKANDRHRMKTRPIFRRFVEEWVPAHHPTSMDCRIWSRGEVAAEATETFKKNEEYEAIMSEWRTQEHEKHLWILISAVVPLKGDKLNLVLRALKRWVTFKMGQPALSAERQMNEYSPWTLQFTEKNEAGLLAWIGVNWEEVKRREKDHISKAKAERLAEKEQMHNNPTIG